MSQNEAKPATIRTVFQFRTLDELMAVCRALYVGGITPNGVDRPEKLLPMILTGMEVGLGIMQSIECVTPPVNGRCSLYGDAGLALIRASGQLQSLKESVEGSGDDRKGICEIQRHGHEARRFEYTMGLAKKLRSYAKSEQWRNDPDNMLMWRARWRAMRTEFTDILKGISGAEEADDIITVEATVSMPTNTQLPPASPPQAAIENAGSGGDEAMQRFPLLNKVKALYERVKPLVSADDLAKTWSEILKPYGFKTAKDMPTQVLEQFVTELTTRLDTNNPPITPF